MKAIGLLYILSFQNPLLRNQILFPTLFFSIQLVGPDQVPLKAIDRDMLYISEVKTYVQWVPVWTSLNQSDPVWASLIWFELNQAQWSRVKWLPSGWTCPFDLGLYPLKWFYNQCVGLWQIGLGDRQYKRFNFYLLVRACCNWVFRSSF